ncbi:TPA: hypothetical protein ND504_004390 [Citrobacter farmeri]|nr:hypothetical protein [Citrobacter farmeri]HCD7631498.1 hypothetical protein [Citrobacter farmeri]
MKKSIITASIIMSSAFFLAACDINESERVETKGNSVQILGGKASVIMPDGFIKMPKELLETKYPLSKRPQEVWYVEKENGKVTIAFSMTINAMSDAQIPQFAQMLKQQFSSVSPILSDVTVNGNRLTRMEMTIPAADSDIYNVMQLSSLEGKLLISTFNTTEDLKETYTEMGKQALSTFKY